MKNRMYIFLCLFLSACVSSTPLPISDVNPLDADDELAPKSLTICLGYEPQSLYPYLANSQAARDVLQAIYDGPIDMLDSQATPVILEDLPSQTAGTTSYASVDVQPGDEVINTAGYPVSLRAGVRVFPAGCFSSDCAVTWDGSTPLQLNQLSAVYRLKEGVSWSDGQPLTAADALFGFQVAADPATPVARQTLDQTFDYRRLDDHRVEWVGKPGLVTDAFEAYFWLPLPAHAWGAYSAGELLENDQANRSPLGWGAYKVVEWQPEEFIRLDRNPFYFRASEGLPYFDELIFKFTNPKGDTNLSNLKFNREPFTVYGLDIGVLEQKVRDSGCDVISTTVDMRDQLNTFNILTNYFKDPSIKLMPSNVGWLELLFFNLRGEDQESHQIFGDQQLRQAITNCLDRDGVNQKIAFGFFEIPTNLFINTSHPYFIDWIDKKAQNFLYAPDEGRQILEQKGWLERYQDGQALRFSHQVDGVADGKLLGFDYLVEDKDISTRTAQLLKQSLSECGIAINLRIVPPEIFWDKDHTDSVFQGNYDLVQLTWTETLIDPCLLFMSANIPTQENNFSGLNFSHYNSTDFDRLCEQLEKTHIPLEKNELILEMESIMAEQIPAVPLFFHPQWLVTRNDFCTDSDSAKTSHGMNLVEEFSYQSECAITD